MISSLPAAVSPPATLLRSALRGAARRCAAIRLALSMLLGGGSFATLSLAALSLAALTAGPAAAAKAGVAAAPCPQDYGPPVPVAAIDGFGDIVLADGTVVVPAGLAFGAGAGALARRRAALTAVLEGGAVALAGAAAPDRYGRRSALLRPVAASAPSTADATVQAALLHQGVALARPEAGFLGCMPALLAAEAQARRARRGLWAELPLRARDEKLVTAQAGRFTILVGRVMAVGNGRRVDYLNFGPVWRQDTTVRLDKSVRTALERAGTPLASLAGQVVAVRGVVVEADGPAIDVRWIEQIERVDATVEQGLAGNW